MNHEKREHSLDLLNLFQGVWKKRNMWRKPILGKCHILTNLSRYTPVWSCSCSYYEEEQENRTRGKLGISVAGITSLSFPFKSSEMDRGSLDQGNLFLGIGKKRKPILENCHLVPEKGRNQSVCNGQTPVGKKDKGSQNILEVIFLGPRYTWGPSFTHSCEKISYIIL